MIIRKIRYVQNDATVRMIDKQKQNFIFDHSENVTTYENTSPRKEPQYE